LSEAAAIPKRDQSNGLWQGIKPYFEKAPIAAFFVGVSSGFPYAMIGATLTTRLKQGGIDKSTITAFTLVFLAYNFKFLWAWIMDGVRLPVIGRLGQRVSWMLVAGTAVIAAVVNLALVDPAASVASVVTAAILVGLLQEGKLPVHALTPLMTIVNRFERVADQAKSIAQEVLYACTGEYTKHRGTEVYRVLFVDEHNSCRSQMAEGIGNALRAAFAPSAYGLPEDLGRLLLRLDERGR